MRDVSQTLSEHVQNDRNGTNADHETDRDDPSGENTDGVNVWVRGWLFGNFFVAQISIFQRARRPAFAVSIPFRQQRSVWTIIPSSVDQLRG